MNVLKVPGLILRQWFNVRIFSHSAREQDFAWRTDEPGSVPSIADGPPRAPPGVQIQE